MIWCDMISDIFETLVNMTISQGISGTYAKKCRIKWNFREKVTRGKNQNEKLLK